MLGTHIQWDLVLFLKVYDIYQQLCKVYNIAVYISCV